MHLSSYESFCSTIFFAFLSFFIDFFIYVDFSSLELLLQSQDLGKNIFMAELLRADLDLVAIGVLM